MAQIAPDGSLGARSTLDGLGSLHQTVVTHLLIYLGIEVVIVGIQHKQGLAGVLQGQIHGDTCGGELVLVSAQIELCGTTVTVGQHLVTQFIHTRTRHGRQLHSHFVAALSLQLVGIQVAPVVAVGVQIYKPSVVREVHVLEVLVLARGWDVDELVAVVC